MIITLLIRESQSKRNRLMFPGGLAKAVSQAFGHTGGMTGWCDHAWPQTRGRTHAPRIGERLVRRQPRR